MIKKLSVNYRSHTKRAIEMNLPSVLHYRVMWRRQFQYALITVIILSLLMVSACSSGESTMPPSPSPSPESSQPTTTPTMEPQRKDQLFGRYPCSTDGIPVFTSVLFPPHLITGILPMGKMNPQSGHVTPTDHLYIHRDVPLGEDSNYVVAPADGFIVDIQRFGQDHPLDRDNPLSPTVPDYRLTFMHSCTVFTIFIHLGEFAPAIAEKVGQISLNGQWADKPIEVKAGEPIAKFGATSLDWSVHDADTTLAGFVLPEHYESEPWKIHTVDPFQLYSEPIKSELLSKMIRTVEPRAGKIDYDIDGKIVGTWFMDGTVDYSGNVPPTSKYWQGHLSIAYGYIDPTQIRISFGLDTGINDELYCNICQGAYGVRGNQPDPATVGPDSGIVKYELMSRTDEGPYQGQEQVGDTSLGTFLVQHLGDRTIRVEVLPEKAPHEVDDFSDASLIYHR